MTRKIRSGLDSIEAQGPAKSKKVLIAFSGGLDSLCLALFYLQKGWCVKLLQINTGVDALKKQKEQKAQENIIRLLEKHARGRVDWRTHETGNIGFRVPDQETFLVQPLEWVRALVENLDTDIDAAALGYLADDGVTISVIDKIKNLYEITRDIRWTDADQPIEFPLLRYEKSYVLGYVPLEFFNLFWTCETPRKSGNRIRACLKCGPCINLTSGMVAGIHVDDEDMVDKIKVLVKRGMVDKRFFQPFLTKND